MHDCKMLENKQVKSGAEWSDAARRGGAFIVSAPGPGASTNL